VPSPKSREELIIETPSAAERSPSRSNNKLRALTIYGHKGKGKQID